MAMKFNRNFNIGRVVKRLVYTILALYVGGQIITEFGSVMNATCSPFYRGLTLIGWTVTTGTCNGVASQPNTITATTGTGVLSVVGIIGIAGVVMEFVQF